MPQSTTGLSGGNGNAHLVRFVARVSNFFRSGSSVDLWINLQARYDAKVAGQRLLPQRRQRIRPHRDAA